MYRLQFFLEYNSVNENLIKYKCLSYNKTIQIRYVID